MRFNLSNAAAYVVSAKFNDLQAHLFQMFLFIQLIFMLYCMRESQSRTLNSHTFYI